MCVWGPLFHRLLLPVGLKSLVKLASATGRSNHMSILVKDPALSCSSSVRVPEDSNPPLLVQDLVGNEYKLDLSGSLA